MRGIPALLFFPPPVVRSSEMAFLESRVLARIAIWFSQVNAVFSLVLAEIHLHHWQTQTWERAATPEQGYTFIDGKVLARFNLPSLLSLPISTYLLYFFAYFNSDCKIIIQSLRFPHKKQANNLDCKHCFLFISVGQGFQHSVCLGLLAFQVETPYPFSPGQLI